MIHGSSFRDPAGFMFRRDGVLYRQVNQQGRAEYDRLMSSGLYDALVASGDLIAHEEVDGALAAAPDAHKVIRPENVPFVSYPFEWSFGQLKDAALLTLRLQKAAMQRGLSLRDATAFNVMFAGGRPVWIDTLSFEALRPGRPWMAYRQFCEMFLAPLALMSRADPRGHQLLRSFLDGIPLPMASAMLPFRTWASPGLLIHVHMHAVAHRRFADHKGPRRTDKGPQRNDDPLPRNNQRANAVAALVDSLERAIQRLDWSPSGTTWGDYYEQTNYTDAAFGRKRELVTAAITTIQPSVVWDLGANDGTFSRLASDAGIRTIAFDVDPAAVEHNYRQVKERSERNLLPLLMDLTNPTASLGWGNAERMSLVERGPADLALALALVHHLAIGHNVPLPRIAAFFASLARALVIEFVPKDDSQVQRMLAARADIFSNYDRVAFEAAFSEPFSIESATPIEGSARTLYVMRRRAT
jgi:hypothetical protein